MLKVAAYLYARGYARDSTRANSVIRAGARVIGKSDGGLKQDMRGAACHPHSNEPESDPYLP